MSKLIKVALATLLVSLAVALPAKEANATRTTGFTNCTVFNVELDAPSATDAGVTVSSPSRLMFHCNNDANTYSAYFATPASGCPTLPFPQVQVWSSMMSAAYISGKTVTLYWSQDTTTCPDRSVTTISLQPPA
jgi:hypothetical protein